jgi:type III restriction enzyme
MSNMKCLLERKGKYYTLLERCIFERMTQVASTGDAAPPPPSDARKRQATRNDRIFRESKEFKAFWERLARRVQYRVAVDTPALIERCAYRLNRESFPAPTVVVEKGDFIVTRYTFKLESVASKKALITIEILNTRGEATTISRYFQERDDLSRILREDRLRGFKILTIVDAEDQSRVCFENARELDLYTPFTFESEAGQRPRERASLVPEITYPVFNLLDRAAHETGLTRSTINMIFKRLSDAKKQVLLKNPEGFAGIFINTINNMLADHIAERVEFAVEDGIKTVDLEELFPPKKPFPQRELIEAGERGLYDQVQVDSQVEVQFVEHRLRADTRVLFYFKFPPAFKVHFPRVIGNYNPDWGIVRYDETGRVILQLIRETKGTQDESKLQFPQERRKIDCARKYFETLQIDYRHITDHTQAWWLPDDAQQQPLEI